MKLRLKVKKKKKKLKKLKSGDLFMCNGNLFAVSIEGRIATTSLLIRGKLLMNKKMTNINTNAKVYPVKIKKKKKK